MLHSRVDWGAEERTGHRMPGRSQAAWLELIAPCIQAQPSALDRALLGHLQLIRAGHGEGSQPALPWLGCTGLQWGQRRGIWARVCGKELGGRHLPCRVCSFVSGNFLFGGCGGKMCKERAGLVHRTWNILLNTIEFGGCCSSVPMCSYRQQDWPRIPDRH